MLHQAFGTWVPNLHRWIKETKIITAIGSDLAHQKNIDVIMNAEPNRIQLSRRGRAVAKSHENTTLLVLYIYDMV